MARVANIKTWAEGVPLISSMAFFDEVLQNDIELFLSWGWKDAWPFKATESPSPSEYSGRLLWRVAPRAIYGRKLSQERWFITSGARRVTNTPTFRLGMKWTLARYLCSLKPKSWNSKAEFQLHRSGRPGKEDSMISDLQLTERACGPKHTPSL